MFRIQNMIMESVYPVHLMHSILGNRLMLIACSYDYSTTAMTARLKENNVPGPDSGSHIQITTKINR